MGVEQRGCINLAAVYQTEHSENEIQCRFVEDGHLQSPQQVAEPAGYVAGHSHTAAVAAGHRIQHVAAADQVKFAAAGLVHSAHLTAAAADQCTGSVELGNAAADQCAGFVELGTAAAYCLVCFVAALKAYSSDHFG